MYLARFYKEWLTTDDQDEKITLTAVLGGIWPRSPFMAELARKTPSTLREFMDWADKFVKVQDTLQALVGSHQEVKKGERRGEHIDRRADVSQQWRKPER